MLCYTLYVLCSTLILYCWCSSVANTAYMALYSIILCWWIHWQPERLRSSYRALY